MGGWYCTECGRPMRRSRWGEWFEHLDLRAVCEWQFAAWLERN